MQEGAEPTTSTGDIATVVRLATLHETLPVIDPFVENVIHLHILSVINGVLQEMGHQSDADEIIGDARQLTKSGHPEHVVIDYVLHYLENFFPELHERIVHALAIKEARESLVDLVEYSQQRLYGAL
jgi:hypothetical protein